MDGRICSDGHTSYKLAITLWQLCFFHAWLYFCVCMQAQLCTSWWKALGHKEQTRIAHLVVATLLRDCAQQSVGLQWLRMDKSHGEKQIRCFRAAACSLHFQDSISRKIKALIVNQLAARLIQLLLFCRGRYLFFWTGSLSVLKY